MITLVADEIIQMMNDSEWLNWFNQIIIQNSAKKRKQVIDIKTTKMNLWETKPNEKKIPKVLCITHFFVVYISFNLKNLYEVNTNRILMELYLTENP